MKRNYFICDGKYYQSGTVIKVRSPSIVRAGSPETHAVFISYDDSKDIYSFCANGCTYHYNSKQFNNIFISVVQACNTSTFAVIKPEISCTQKMENEMNIDALFIAWIWYIFIMLMAIIFNERLFIWIFTSIIFFQYRDKKLKEEGYKK